MRRTCRHRREYKGQGYKADMKMIAQGGFHVTELIDYIRPFSCEIGISYNFICYHKMGCQKEIF